MGNSEEVKTFALAIRDGKVLPEINIEDNDIFQLLDSDFLKVIPGISKEVSRK